MGSRRVANRAGERSGGLSRVSSVLMRCFTQGCTQGWLGGCPPAPTGGVGVVTWPAAAAGGGVCKWRMDFTEYLWERWFEMLWDPTAAWVLVRHPSPNRNCPFLNLGWPQEHYHGNVEINEARTRWPLQATVSLTRFPLLLVKILICVCSWIVQDKAESSHPLHK